MSINLELLVAGSRTRGMGMNHAFALNTSTAAKWIWDLRETDTFSFQLLWDAALTATILIELGNDYIPNLAVAGATPDASGLQVINSNLRDYTPIAPSNNNPSWNDATSAFTKFGTAPTGGSERSVLYVYPRLIEVGFCRLTVTPNGSSPLTNLQSFASRKAI
jgi:hypothetical protein